MSDNLNIDAKQSPSSLRTHFTIRWCFSISIPILFYGIMFFFFKTVYLFYLQEIDPEYFLGYILEAPITFFIVLESLYILVPKHRKPIIIIVCIIMALINLSSFLDIIFKSYGFNNLLRYWQNIFSGVLTYIVFVLFPIMVSKRERFTRLKNIENNREP